MSPHARNIAPPALSGLDALRELIRLEQLSPAPAGIPTHVVARTDRITATRPRATARRPGRAGAPASPTAALVDRAQGGDSEAFGQLYDHYADMIYRYVYYRVDSRATAEDLTSETFLRALRRINTYTWQGKDFGAWLVTIARNIVVDHFGSARVRREVTTDDMVEPAQQVPSPEDSVLRSLSNAALLAAVRQLTAQQQECVTLRFLEGLSITDTARIMGKSEGSIKTLQFRAVRTLARLLPGEAP